MASYANAARHGTTRAEALVRMAVGALGRLAFALLVAFHAWLLWSHLVAGKAFEPGTALRWLVAVGVLVGFRALSRHGLPLVFGRRAVALWLLVILIHCHAVWTGDVVTTDLGVPETLHALSQIIGSTSVLGALAVVLLVTQTAAVFDAHLAVPASARVAGLPSDGFTYRFAPRPPPLA
jgi:hypothetical protein